MRRRSAALGFPLRCGVHPSQNLTCNPCYTLKGLLRNSTVAGTDSITASRLMRAGQPPRSGSFWYHCVFVCVCSPVVVLYSLTPANFWALRPGPRDRTAALCSLDCIYGAGISPPPPPSKRQPCRAAGAAACGWSGAAEAVPLRGLCPAVVACGHWRGWPGGNARRWAHGC